MFKWKICGLTKCGSFLGDHLYSYVPSPMNSVMHDGSFFFDVMAGYQLDGSYMFPRAGLVQSASGRGLGPAFRGLVSHHRVLGGFVFCR